MNANKLARALLPVALVTALTGCSNLLDVKQPGLITDEKVGNESLQASLVAAAAGDYHRAFNWMANSGAALTDEGIFGHGWSPWEEYDNRAVTPSGGAWDGIGYAYMQAAKTTAARVVGLLGAQANADLRAQALNWDGYAAMMLADYLCSVPFNGGAPVTREAAYDTAIVLLKQAAAVSGATPAQVNLANLGIARAYLNKGDFANAASYASKVPLDFEAWINFIDADFGDWATKYNLYARTSGLKAPTEFNMGIDPNGDVAQMRDLRVPFETDSARLMFTSHPEPRRAYVPFTPYSFQNWSPGNKRMIQGGDGIRFASGLEAQYILAEAGLNSGAGGMSQAQVQAFVNARRAVGGLQPYTGTDLKAELRQQRKMDFYWAGYRMPDLLRYKKLYNVDLFPTGKMGGFPAGAPYQYGTTTCLPIGQSEVANNPNIH